MYCTYVNYRNQGYIQPTYISKRKKTRSEEKRREERKLVSVSDSVLDLDLDSQCMYMDVYVYGWMDGCMCSTYMEV